MTSAGMKPPVDREVAGLEQVVRRPEQRAAAAAPRQKRVEQAEEGFDQTLKANQTPKIARGILTTR